MKDGKSIPCGWKSSLSLWCCSFVTLTHIPSFIVVEEFAVVDCTDTQLTFDGRNQWRTLEQSSTEFLETLFDFSHRLNWSVQLEDGNVFLTSGLLRFHKTSSTIDAHNQAAC